MKWHSPCEKLVMKKIFLGVISLIVLIAVINVPRLQAEDWRGCGTTSLPIYVEEEGEPVFPILCFEAVGYEQMAAVRGKYASGIVLSVIESAEDRGRIILWDESKGISNPQTNCSYGNNRSYSVLTAIGYK